VLINVTQHSDSIWFSFAELIECFLDTLNIGLIVDGTGHALALQVLRERKKTIINGKKR
jgi:hypothetical protein